MSLGETEIVGRLRALPEKHTQLDKAYYGDSLIMDISADESFDETLDARAFAASWNDRILRGAKADNAAQSLRTDEARAEKFRALIAEWVDAFAEEVDAESVAAVAQLVSD